MFAIVVANMAGAKTLSVMRWPDYSDFQPQVEEFYDNRNDELAWTRGGLPTQSAMALIQVFESAALKGLTPADYDAGSRLSGSDPS